MTAVLDVARDRRFAVRVPWKLVRLAVFYVGLIALWQLVYELEVRPAYAFPSPSDVWETLRVRIEDGTLWDATRLTMTRMAIGYSLSIVIGLALGLAMGAFKWVDETVGSLILGLQSLPSVLWLPPALLWFGLNEKAIIFVVVMGATNSIAISTRAGIRTIPPLLMRAGRMFGGKRWQLYLYVVVPGMLPSIIQGLKLGWSFAWRSLLAAELLFVGASLGFLVETGRSLSDASLMYAVMVVIVTIGIVADRLVFAQLERIVNERWGLNGA